MKKNYLTVLLMTLVLCITGCSDNSQEQTVIENEVTLENQIEEEPKVEVEKVAEGRHRYKVKDLSQAEQLEGEYEAYYYIPEEIPTDRLKEVMLEYNGDSMSMCVASNDSKRTIRGEIKESFKLTKSNINGTAEEICLVGVTGNGELRSITFYVEAIKVEEAKQELAGALTEDCFKEDGNNNPIVTQRYSADPCAMVYEDTVYIYSTNDIYEYKGNTLGENTYGKITTINCFGSKDLVNWTDYGAIAVAGRRDGKSPALWANNSWAPTAAHKKIDGKEKFFLYFADNGSGIGVLTADSPTGPFTDPIGKQLVSRETPTCASVTWLFDPAVLVDDNGEAYLYFGGGVPEGQSADPGTARVVKLGEDMISLAGDPVVINPPYLFEDSGINKIGDTYYYSYCSNWNCTDGIKNGTIYYMTSKNPMGPFEFQGEAFANPASFFNDGNGNNHHSFFEFNGKLYLTYHARALERKAVGKPLGYRSTQIDEVNLENGKIVSVKGTMEGVEKASDFNPYETQKATTIYRQKGIEVLGSGDTVLTVTEGDFTGVKDVNFEKGARTISISVKAAESMTIDVLCGNENGEIISKIEVSPTNDTFKTFTADIKNQSGYTDIYFVYHGNAEIENWVVNP